MVYILSRTRNVMRLLMLSIYLLYVRIYMLCVRMCTEGIDVTYSTDLLKLMTDIMHMDKFAF